MKFRNNNATYKEKAVRSLLKLSFTPDEIEALLAFLLVWAFDEEERICHALLPRYWEVVKHFNAVIEHKAEK